MSKKRREYWTQGSELYVIGPDAEDPSQLVCIKIQGVSDIGMPEPTRNKVDSTTLDETEIETSIPGLLSSAEMTITCNYLDDDPGQMYLEQMEDSEVLLTFAIGFSKGKGIKPEVTADSFTLPNSRGWCRFSGEVSTSGIQTPKNAVMPFVCKVDVTSKPKVLRAGRTVEVAKMSLPKVEDKK